MYLWLMQLWPCVVVAHTVVAYIQRFPYIDISHRPVSMSVHMLVRTLTSLYSAHFCTDMAYIAMACVVMAHVVMAYIVKAYMRTLTSLHSAHFCTTRTVFLVPASDVDMVLSVDVASGSGATGPVHT